MMRFDRFTERAQDAATRAYEILQRYKHNQVDTEHILMALLEQPDGQVSQLLEKMGHQLANFMTEIEVFIPQDKMHLVSLIYRQGQVFKQEYQNDKIYLQARISPKIKAKLENLLKQD